MVRVLIINNYNHKSFYSGLWSIIAVGIFLVGKKAECSLYATFEGICFCRLKIPYLVLNKLLIIIIINDLYHRAMVKELVHK